MFLILSSMKAETKLVLAKLHRVSDFLEVFPDDISDFPSEHEVEFSIDLVAGISLVLMALIGYLLRSWVNRRSKWKICLKRSLFVLVFHCGMR